MRFDAIQSNFTTGELSPKLWGRIELEKYHAGLATLENMIVQPHGGVDRRGGFHYVAEVKNSTKKTKLISFNYMGEYSYILEFGHLYMRVYVGGIQVQDGGSPYEIATPYTADEIDELRFCQDADTLHLVHKNHTPAKLTRTSHTAWTLADITFTAKPSNWEEQDWRSICWSPELDIFVAVADSGASKRVMTSSDSITWVRRTTPGVQWKDVCWSPDLSLFCAVGNNIVMTSPDGINWTSRTPAASNDWEAVCWSPELNLFCAVSDTGTGNRVMTSSDGIIWVARTSASEETWSLLCWSSDLSLFCAVADSGVGTGVMTSPDGINWTTRTPAADNMWLGMCWSSEVDLFVVVGYDLDDERVMTSPDGINWTLRITGISHNYWKEICWSPSLSLFVAIGTDHYVMTSPDGINWTLRTGAGDGHWSSICWSPDLGLLCAVSYTDANRVMTSPDGINWTFRTGAGNFPTLTWFYEQRLFWGSTPEKPEKIWGSQSGDYYNLDPGTGLDNEALIFSLKQAIKLLWASPGQEIILGAHNGEFKLSANAFNEALTPSNVRPASHTSYGNAFLPPVRIDESVLFTQRGKRKLRRFALASQTGSYSSTYTAENVTILSEHITKTGIKDIAYFNEPNSIVWMVREDGILIGLTYEPEHKIYGWHRHPIGGIDAKIKSIATVDVVEGVAHDELWAIIERTIDGSTVQYIEYMLPGLTIEADKEDAFFVDSGITQTGSGFTVVTGLDHLEGETVQILGNGVKQTSKIAIGGSVTLDTAVDKAQVGLQYKSILETLPIEGGNPIGVSQSLIKIIKNVSLRLHRSLGVKIGDIFGNMDTYQFDSNELFTDDTEPMPFAGGYDRRSQVRIVQEDPLPLEIQAIIYNARTE